MNNYTLSSINEIVKKGVLQFIMYYVTMLHSVVSKKVKDKSNFKISYPEQRLLQLLILRYIFEGPIYGYALMNKIRNADNNSMVIKSGTMYTTLRRMEKNELIKSVWEDSDIGPSKRMYDLTPLGKKYLNEKLAAISRKVPVVQELVCFYKDTFDGKV